MRRGAARGSSVRKLALEAVDGTKLHDEGAVAISNSGIEHGTWLSALPDQWLTSPLDGTCIYVQTRVRVLVCTYASTYARLSIRS